MANTNINNNLDNNINIRQYSPLALAYMGDSVFDLYVRDYLLKKANTSANKLHQGSKSIVNAKSQSIMYYKLIEICTEEEIGVLKRGRNAKSNTKAKNASMAEYKNATGLEALFGYLHLQNNISRLDELFIICIECVK